MDRTERFYKIDQLLHAHGVVPASRFQEVLGVSNATFRRDLEYMRERLYAPIAYDRQRRGYSFVDADPHAPRYQLPGLWFNSAEIHALLTFHALLENLQADWLAPHVRPLQQRIRALLEKHDHTYEEIARRVRVLPQAARTRQAEHFSVIAHAMLKRKRLDITHYHRLRNQDSRREISPQRLVYYRDNWYLDAWDHGKRALRTFGVDAIRDARMLDTGARAVADSTLDAELGAGYGIFAGRRTRTARLRFTPERARWVASERWHPSQKGCYEGRHYILEIPYSDPRELLMDILKYGPDVEVLKPKTLRQQAQAMLRQALEQYETRP